MHVTLLGAIFSGPPQRCNPRVSPLSPGEVGVPPYPGCPVLELVVQVRSLYSSTLRNFLSECVGADFLVGSTSPRKPMR